MSFILLSLAYVVEEIKNKLAPIPTINSLKLYSISSNYQKILAINKLLVIRSLKLI